MNKQEFLIDLGDAVEVTLLNNRQFNARLIHFPSQSFPYWTLQQIVYTGSDTYEIARPVMYVHAFQMMEKLNWTEKR